MNYEVLQAFPPPIVNFLSLPKTMTKIKIDFPEGLHLPANPYHLSVQSLAGFSCRLQL